MERRTRSRLRALLAAWVLSSAAPARADWVQVAPPTGVSATANLRAVVVAGADTWVVGDDGTSPVILRGFEPPTLVPQAEHGATGPLQVACGFADGSLHAFGKSNAHASWVAGNPGAWTPFNQPLSASVTPLSAACVASVPNLVYVAGAWLMLEPYLGEWRVGDLTATRANLIFAWPIDAAGFRGADDGLLGVYNELHSFPAESTSPVSGVPGFVGEFRAIRLSSSGGLAVGRDSATPRAVVLLVDAGNAVMAGGDPGFALVNDATLLDSGFAVVVGDAGAVAVSHDGGASWSSRSIPSGPNLLSVACRDEVHCYLSGATAALYSWRNEAPTAQITAVVDGSSREPVGGVLMAAGQEWVCLTAVGFDSELQPLGWQWSEATGTLKGLLGEPLNGSIAASPECFALPQCGGAFDVGVTANDGELTGSAALSLQASAAPIEPTLQLDFTNGFANGGLLSGTSSTDARVTPSHPCASGFDFAWSCLDSEGAVFAPGNVSFASFANPGDLCRGKSIVCSVAVTPTLAGQPSSTTGVSVSYAAAASRPTTVDASFASVSAQGVVAPGQTGSVTLAPQNRCAASYWAFWSCTDGVDPGALALTRDFVHPGTTACGGQAVDCTVRILPDLGDPTESAFTVRYEPSARPVVIGQAFSGALSTTDQRLAAGESGQVTLAPAQDGCATGFEATWSCSDGVNPGVDVFARDFTNARVSGCADEAIGCGVEVRSVLTGEVGTASLSVVLSPNPGPVLAPASFSTEFAGGERLMPGQSGQVTIAPSQGDCTTSYQTVWSCSDGVNPVAGELSRAFTNARSSGCSDERIDCSVEVTSALTEESMTTSFSVALAPNPGPTAVAFTYDGFGAGNALGDGQTGTVTAAANSECPGGFDYLWRCEGLPDATGAARSFAHGQVLCDDAALRCTVEASPLGAGRAGSAEVALRLLASGPFPASLEVELSGPTTLAKGERLAAAVVARHCPGASFSYAWECSGTGASAQGAVASFNHPGLLCEGGHATCQVSVTATSAEGVAQPAASLPTPIAVNYQPAFAPPANLRVAPMAAAADEIAAEAQIDVVCPFTPDYSWRATLRSSGELVGEGSGSSFGAALPPLCGRDHVDLVLTEATTGQSATAELAVEGWHGEVVLADPIEQGYESRPQLDCEAARAPVVLVPQPSGCVRGLEWRQTAGPPLDVEQREDGALVVGPGAFGGLVGRQARFEVEAFNDDGRSPARAFALTFVPKPFLKIHHVADRPMAAAGEVVTFAVQLEGRCATPPEALDLHLALEDLDYLPGSARLGEQTLAEPERSGNELVFRAVPLSAGSTPRIVYSARRRALGSAQASSVASAFLSVAPEMRVSEEAAAGSADDDAEAVPVLACSCGQAPAPAAPWVAGLGLVLLRRRRRSAC